MATKLALAFLTFSSIVVLVVLLFDLAALSWLFATAVMGFPIALVALAVSRHDGLGRLRIPLLILLVMLQAGGIGVLALGDSPVTGWYGLPLSLHLLLLLVWLGPLVITTVAYAATFGELGIDDALLERLEKMRADARDGGERGPV